MKPSKTRFVTGLILITLITVFISSCKTIPEPEKTRIILSRKLLAQGNLSAEQLAGFFIQENAQKDYQEMYDFACLYIQEAADENINSDIAFAQMCHETGFLKFGGLVQPEWHNYCGLGAISSEEPGCQFETAQLGVRAHIQHIQAYATTEDIPLNNALIDPRYTWVHKTKYAVTLGDFAKSWAADPEYAQKLEKMLQRMEAFVNQ